MCVGCSALCPSVKVYVVFRVADNLCSSSSKAIWALFIAALTRYTTGHFACCDFKGSSLAVGGRFPGIVPAFWTPPLGRSPPSHTAEPLAAACIVTGGTGLEPRPPLRVGHFERYALPKGTKPIVAYVLGSQEKYLVAKCILRDQDMVYSLCKLQY